MCRWSRGLLVVALVAALPARARQVADWEELERLETAGGGAAALEVLESLPSPDGAAERLRRLRTRHRLLHGLGRFDEAQRVGREWIEAALATGDHVAAREAYQQTGRSLGGMDRNEEAIAMFRQAMTRAAPDADGTQRVRLALDLAAALVSAAELPEAQNLLDEVEEGHDPKDAYVTYRLWLSRARILATIGDLRGAVEYGERALAAAEALEDERRVAIATINLGQSVMKMHDYARALTLYRRALELGPTTDLEVIAITSIGICHFELNQRAEAREAFARARALARELGRPSLEAWAAGELGLVAWQQGDAQEALELFDRAIAITRELDDPVNEAIWWTNKGLVRRDQERWEEALAFYRQAVAVEGTVPGRRPLANLRKHMGQCHAGLGDDATAAALFAEAIRLAEATGDEKVLWETHLEIARLRRRAGDLEAAAAAYERSLDGIESLRGSLQLESFKTDFFENKVRVYAEVVSFLAAADGLGDAQRAFEVAERARARAFLDSLVEARAELDETLPRQVLDEERALLAEISSLQAEIRRREATPDLRGALEEKEQELEAFHLQVRSRYPRFRDLRYPQPVSVGDAQARLAEGEVLLEYLLAEPTSHLWVVSRDGFRHHLLPGEPEIEAAVREAYAAFLSPDSPPRLERLAGWLIAPLSLAREDTRSIVIVPSGILHYFPFEALPVGEGGGVLGEIAATSYLPSASVLVELAGRAPRTVEPRLLALGDAEYGGAPSPSRLALPGPGDLGSLPHTRSEIRRVRRLFGRDASTVLLDRQATESRFKAADLGSLPHTRSEIRRVRRLFGRDASTVLLDRQATESRFKAADLASYSVLHLATHGFIDASSPARSGLVLGVGEGDDEDGILQFREVLHLPLAAELVTLSACNSALGELVTGEGMVGLARSFFYAGADAVVASLWNVDDEATALFMESFYRALSEGASKGEALERARLEIRNTPSYEDPYYWAPYVLLGRGGDGVSFPHRQRPVVLLLGSSLLALLVLLAALRLSSRRRSSSTPTGPPTRSRR